jgi:tRNA G18 (ribose-2'-O)-methylase SpoU
MKKEKRIILVIHDVRSAHNVGSMFRTADGAGVDEIVLTGFTPRPHRYAKRVGQACPAYEYLTAAEKSFNKTALGAEESVLWRKVVSLPRLIGSLRKAGYEIVALEQYEGSVQYDEYRPKRSVALIVGNEVLGVEKKIMECCDTVIEIPMHGAKNSLNVSVAAGIALYHLQQCAD